MYLIADYETRYKPYDRAGRDLVNATWVKLPVKPKGMGLEVLLEHKRGLEVFAVWCLLLEATTKQKVENRGKLLNHKDEPASIQEIAKSVSLKSRVGLVEYALTLLVTMGWIECTHNVDIVSTELRKSAEQCSVVKCSVVKSKYTPEFEIFWKKAWKGRWEAETDIHRKGSKMKAFEVWQTLSIDEQRAAYAAAAKTRSWSFVPDCNRWLKEKRWEK